jgi:hypothetical protein
LSNWRRGSILSLDLSVAQLLFEGRGTSSLICRSQRAALPASPHYATVKVAQEGAASPSASGLEYRSLEYDNQLRSIQMIRFVRSTVLTVALLVCVAFIAIGAWNYLTVSRPVAVANGDQRIRASVHYQRYLNPSVLCFNLTETHGSSMMDVFLVLLRSAKALNSHTFGKVELQYRGDLRFILDGEYFAQLGNWNQDPVFLITGRASPIGPKLSASFTSHVFRIDGTKAFSEVTRPSTFRAGLAGMLSGMTDQADAYGDALDQFRQFYEQWIRDEPQSGADKAKPRAKLTQKQEEELMLTALHHNRDEVFAHMSSPGDSTWQETLSGRRNLDCSIAIIELHNQQYPNAMWEVEGIALRDRLWGPPSDERRSIANDCAEQLMGRAARH